MTNTNIHFGIVGLGAFGQFMAKQLLPYGNISAFDTSAKVTEFAHANGITLTRLEDVAKADQIILAVPIDAMEATVKTIAPHLKQGAIVLDVGSVKVKPAEILRDHLPDHVTVIGTHPLFGPQSAAGGLKGHKIAVCPIRGDASATVRFLSNKLGLDVIETTPEDHDKELAAVQGLTHMIAKIMVQMEPLPTTMTTRSFDLICEAIDMVRYDSEELFLAIERENPYSEQVRKRFFNLAALLRARLEE